MTEPQALWSARELAKKMRHFIVEVTDQRKGSPINAYVLYREAQPGEPRNVKVAKRRTAAQMLKLVRKLHDGRQPASATTTKEPQPA